MAAERARVSTDPVETPLVGLVTVTYNSASVIDSFIQSALNQVPTKLLLYIVDNVSRDDTVSRVRAYSDSRIRLIESPTNSGFAGGSNFGIRAALDEGCSHVLIINNDTIFSAGLVEGLLAAEGQLKADITVPKILWLNEPSRIWAAGGDFNRLRGYASFHFGENEIDTGKYEVAREVDFAPGCCMLVRRDVVERVGYFDENFFVYTEDADYCWRAKRLGIRMWYTPSVSLLHHVSALTGGSRSPFVSYYTTRNRVLFIRKHLRWYESCLWLASLQVLLNWRLLSGRENSRMYRIRQRAFLDGISGRRASAESL